MARRLVVIGGDAGGMAAATNARRHDADLDITVLEKGRWTSYSACGFPYLVSGAVGDPDDLIARHPQEFRDQFRIDVRLEHEATAIDLDARRVDAYDRTHERAVQLGFDELVIGTGARPLRPDIPGIDEPFVHGVQTMEDATHLLEHATEGPCHDVVVVGGGYIGLEMAEAFLERSCRVTVLEAAPQILGPLDADMAELVADAMRRRGIDVRTGTKVTGFRRGAVETASGDVTSDLIVLGMGVVPNSELAGAAGIALGERNAIRVDRRQRTSADGVWAAGDCCESFHLVSQRPVHLPLGTVANRQARVAGVNIGGGYATFSGVVGTAITKICSTEIARTGLSEREATAAGFGFESVTIESTTRAGYFPGAAGVTVKMLGERRTGRILGAQIVGGAGAAKRIDVVATALTVGLTAAEVMDLDLSYAPPFSPLWDPVAVAARQLTARV